MEQNIVVRDWLEQALRLRPNMEMQDAVKLLYQSVFGPGHLVKDPAAARSRLADEMHICKGDSLPSYEEISPALCRLNLAPAKAMGCSPKTVGMLFLRCARHSFPVPENWPALLDVVKDFSFPVNASHFSLEAYRAAGCPPLHHSETYRALYHPAYRVVWTQEARYLPLLACLDTQLKFHGSKPLFVAIDGMSASGKSTLGALLADVYGDTCTLLHMDDYFLPPEKKTAERLSIPGGNVDWERFSKELLQPLLEGQIGSLRRYDCKTGQMCAPQAVSPSRLIVVEGSYSLHPRLRDSYDIAVFCSISPEMQMKRIVKRNGSELAKRFQTEWIPLENAYFSAYHVSESCSFHF